jgi:hypothetical protein
MPGIRRFGPKGPDRRAVLATTTPLAQAGGGAGKSLKWPKSTRGSRFPPQPGRLRGRSGSRLPVLHQVDLSGRIMRSGGMRPRIRRLRGGWGKPNMSGR